MDEETTITMHGETFASVQTEASSFGFIAGVETLHISLILSLRRYIHTVSCVGEESKMVLNCWEVFEHLLLVEYQVSSRAFWSLNSQQSG